MQEAFKVAGKSIALGFLVFSMLEFYWIGQYGSFLIVERNPHIFWSEVTILAFAMVVLIQDTILDIKETVKKLVGGK